MDWKDVYRKLDEGGYYLALPTSHERTQFRKNISLQNGLIPSQSQSRVIYILGRKGKIEGKFFGNDAELKRASQDFRKICEEIQAQDSSFQYCGYLHYSTPLELVSRRLCAGQGTIEFISPFQDHKAVCAMWKK